MLPTVCTLKDYSCNFSGYQIKAWLSRSESKQSGSHEIQGTAASDLLNGL